MDKVEINKNINLSQHFLLGELTKTKPISVGIPLLLRDDTRNAGSLSSFARSRPR